MFRPLLERLRPVPAWWPARLNGLIVSTVGGAICLRLHSPLPWMIGPLLAMALFQFSGTQFTAVRWSREAGQFFIAVTLGLYFTPAVAHEVAANWTVLLAAAFASIGIGCVSALFLVVTAKVDATTAYFASIPGGASEMAQLGDRFEASAERVAVAHSLRILLVVCTVPVALTVFGVPGTDDYRPVTIPLQWGGLFLLFAVVALFGAVASRIRFPNPWMMGPLIGTILLTSNGVQLSAMPGWLPNVGQVLLGCWLGTRFSQAFLRHAPRFVACLVPSIYLTMAIAALVGLALSYLAGLSAQTMILATAPGGIAEMSITARTLKLGVALVTAAHVTRVLIIVSFTLPVFRALRHLRSLRRRPA